MSELTPEQRCATFGKLVRELREAAGLSQRQLVEQLNAEGCRDHFGRPVTITYAYLSRIETGDRYPSVNVVEALAATLGVTSTWMLLAAS